MNSQQHGDEFEKTDVEINPQNVKFILMDGFEYSFNRMLGDAQKWKCTNNSCYAYFKILNSVLLPGVMAHTHPRKDEDSSQDSNNGFVKREASPERQIQSPILQGVEVPDGGMRAYPSNSKSDQSHSRNQLDASSVGLKKMKFLSGKTVIRRTSLLKATASSPSSGFMSDQEPASTFLLDASPSVSQTPPPKSPKLSEVGPPPTPPLSRNSSLYDSDPSSPLPPIIDLVDGNSRPLSSSDLITHIMSPPTNTNLSTEASSSNQSTYYLHSHHSKNLSKHAKYKEYENQIMQLDREHFGYAVTSLLSELPPKTAEDIQYEIATLLYEAVEGHKNSRPEN